MRGGAQFAGFDIQHRGTFERLPTACMQQWTFRTTRSCCAKALLLLLADYVCRQ
jgi:hypothetical protein